MINNDQLEKNIFSLYIYQFLQILIGALIIQLVGYTLIGNGVPDAAVLVCKGTLIIISVWLQKSETINEN